MNARCAQAVAAVARSGARILRGLPPVLVPRQAPRASRRRGAAAAMNDLMISLSSEVQPEFREYERFSTAVLNAYLQPVMGRYLSFSGGAARQRCGERQGRHLSEQRRPDVDRHRAPLPGADRALRPRGRRSRSDPYRTPGRASQRHHARHGRHQRGCRAHPQLRGGTELRSRRRRLSGAAADGRYPYRRRRRRLDRLVRSRRPAQGRTRPAPAPIRAPRAMVAAERARPSPTPISSLAGCRQRA